MEFHAFLQKKDHLCVFIRSFFLRGNPIEPMVLADQEVADSNGNQEL